MHQKKESAHEKSRDEGGKAMIGNRAKRALLLAGLCAGALLGSVSAASATVVWKSETWIRPTHLVPGEPGWFHVTLMNAGDTKASESPTTVAKVVLPAGVSRPSAGVMEDGGWVCLGATTVTCSKKTVANAFSFEAGDINVRSFSFPVNVSPSASGAGTTTISVSGGGAVGTAVETQQVTFSKEPLGFGFTPGSLLAGAFDSVGLDYLQAGGHPHDARAAFRVNLHGGPLELGVVAGGVAKDVVVSLPPGFVGDPSAVPQCTHADFPDCPSDTQVGVAFAYTPILNIQRTSGVYNMEPPADQPAQFAFDSPGGKIVVEPSVRSDGDYGITMTVRDIPEKGDLWASNFVIWGMPMDPVHDEQRCRLPNSTVESCAGVDNRGQGSTAVPDIDDYVPHSSSVPRRSFLSLPTQCATAPETTIRIDPWLDPVSDVENLNDPKWQKHTIVHPKQTGCELLEFDPSITLQPGAKAADTPSGLTAHLNLPQEADPDLPATAHLKKAVVTLPEGVGVSASQADGVDACSPAQIGLVSAPGQTPIRFDNAPPKCPTASKIGSAQVITPVLPNPLSGELFLASQDQNPFGSRFAVYIVVREPSIQVKLPGLVRLDPTTGQITTVFDQNPQLPFSDLNLTFFGGPRGALVTPQTCGTFVSHSQFSPWSAVDPENPTSAETVETQDSFPIDRGANGAPCATSKAQLPFGLGFQAGTVNPLAGAHSPFSMQVTRPDGAQEIDRFELTTPEGFSATLKGIPYCSDAQIAAAPAKTGKAEQASPSCPAASQIGTTQVGAGAGNPFYVEGKLYLSGPYKGSKLSLVAIVPAVAGPFDLGVQVVRSALKVNPTTAQITAVTDPIPTILEGVPLRVRDVRVNIDRPNFALNPTDCSEQQVQARVFGTAGAIANLSNRFQVGGCESLGFKPSLSIHLKGGTKRGDFPGLKAILRARPGDANIERAAVTLPRSAFLEQGHLNNICTRVRFAANDCPKGSVYGYAKATSPLIDGTIEGPVYLRSSNNKLPDLVADLDGQVDVELVGRIDSVKVGNGQFGIRNTFDVVPDAPVTKFTITMRGGKKGLVVNSTNLCAATNRADVRLNAQNGKRRNFRTPVVADGCKKGRKRGGKRR